MPKKALLKTFVLNKKEEYDFLNNKIGRENFEYFYGGDMEETHRSNIEKYSKFSLPIFLFKKSYSSFLFNTKVFNNAFFGIIGFIKFQRKLKVGPPLTI